MAKSDPSTSEGLESVRYAHLALMLNRYVAEIETILERLANGEFAEVPQLPKLKRELMSVAKQLRDAEIQSDEFERDQRRRASHAGAAIDMDAARDAIRGRLARLRESRGAGRVPEAADGR